MENVGLYKITTFGCQMNVHESEKIAGILRSLGYFEADTEEDADILAFNTCCIRDTAEKRALGRIAVSKTLKKNKPGMIIAVCGCMPQQAGKSEEIKAKMTHVDIILGANNLEELRPAIESILEKRTRIVSVSGDENPAITEEITPFRTSGENAWVNIMYGCNNFCTYCIVPYVRGRERSRKPEAVLADVAKLAGEGYKTITLLGQNVNSYAYGFSELLEEISKIEGDFKVRFMTSHPKDFNPKVIEIIAKSEKLAKTVHLPVQAGSDKILSAMGRGYTQKAYLKIIENIRKKIPGAEITTDIMVGFPGETDEDFKETLNLLRAAKFARAFTFIYSPRRGTPAEAMEQIPYKIKQQRIAELIRAVKLCGKI